ncbi:MAG: sulfotransferase, partial [Gammaproteobacteria bacterium]|nr:sulfotransferase [Gammaproteobacteria bacterium]
AEANYMAAVCQRYLNNYAQAQQHLDALKDLALDKGRVYQEQGHLYRAQGLNAQALVAYQTACQLNPALSASWKAQVELFVSIGRPADAQQAKMQMQRLQNLPKALVSVTDLIAQGKLFKAEALCKQFLKQSPTHAEAMRLLADIALRLGAMEEAEFLLASAIEFNPDNTQIKLDHIKVLRRRQKFEESMRAAESLVHSNAGNPQFQSVYAIAKMQFGDYAEAVARFDKVLALLPNDPVTHTSKGHALKTWGKNSAAVESYRAAIARDPGYCEAYYALANLKTYRFDDAEIEAMLKLDKSDTLTPGNGVHLYFALGKAFEDVQDWDRSFAYYQKGNGLKKLQSSYSAEKMTEELLSQRSFFTRETIERLGRDGYPDAAPIFIVGLPRAGSTLLEQILSSHSMVDGTLELPHMLSIAQKLRRKGRQKEADGYPELIASLSADQRYALGKQYIDETNIHRSGAPFFIDKMPNNFRHIGLIKIILPNAKIIDARRFPLGCCFSGFKQLFAEGQEFTYSLDDIGQYYNDYVTLMQHWDAVIPGDVLRVRYEDVTENIESQVVRMLDYCGLPFENGCLEFHKTKRAVRTASSEQVRQPLYKSGVDHWRNFETHLQPLINKLSPSLLTG